MEDSGDIEEGEILDSYTPLQRPESLNVVVKTEPSDEQPVSSDDNDDNDNDSDDDSDQDSDSQRFRPKKLKVKREKLCKPVPAAKSNKYNVWSIGLQEEALTATLEKCDVESVDRSRDVESYFYKSKFYDFDKTTAGISDQLSEVSVKKEIKTEPQDYQESNNKRRHDEQRNGKQRIKRHLSPHRQWSKPRILPELEVTTEDPVEIVAADVAAKLFEQKDHLIMRTAEVIGVEKTIKLYNETKLIEFSGGMLVMNGSRRRTSGGVFLTLLKKDEDVTQDMLKEIFGPERTFVTKARRQTLALKRKQKTNELRKSLIEDGLLNNDFPEILEQKVRELPVDRKIKSEPDECEGDHAVSNPPPSPATDQDTPPPNIRQITSYDDDEFLDIGGGGEEMELF